MTPGLSIAAFVIVGIVGSLSAMAGQFHERRRWERRMLEKAGFAELAGGLVFPLAVPTKSTSDDRLSRLEQNIDAMAAELERVGEGQRFLTKVLAERSDRYLANTPP